ARHSPADHHGGHHPGARLDLAGLVPPAITLRIQADLSGWGASQEEAWTARPSHPHDRLMRITLRQLAVFEAVARTGSIVRAAADIGLSPSAASMSLKDFEMHLGVELFARQGKKLLLSDHGREVREK